MDPISVRRRPRPGFVIAAGVLVVILVLALVVVLHREAGRDRAEAAPPARHGTTSGVGRPSAAPTGSPTRAAGAADGGDSICGLPDGPAIASEFTAPPAIWRYDGVVAYPTSERYGPGASSPAGFRYCFQHSAQGALFSVAGSIAFNNRDRATSDAWSRYMLATGPYRERALHSRYVPADPTIRSRTVGYRMLSYDGEHAKIDLAVRIASTQQTVLSSIVVDMVWQRGDWRFSSDVPTPVQVTRLVDLTGYTGWSDA